MGHTFTTAEHTLTKPSIIGTWPCGGPWGLNTRESVSSAHSKIVYSRRSSPVTLTTWMRTLAMFLAFSTSNGSSWDFPLVNAAITNFAFFRLTLELLRCHGACKTRRFRPWVVDLLAFYKYLNTANDQSNFYAQYILKIGMPQLLSFWLVSKKK